MASFTDNLVGFNPYVFQVPVDDYVRVGMIKQEQYKQGVQAVQGYIDSVAGIEALKPEQKEYLQKRVSNIQQEVGKVVSADFSRQQIINSVGSLTSKIASDPIVKNTMYSTDMYKHGLASIQEAKEKGKSSVSNEWDFNDQFQKWYSDGDVSTKFTGSFTPYTDVTTKVSKIIKDLDPNVHIEDIPFKRGDRGEIIVGKDGTPEIDWAMKHIESKNITPERIEAAISANLTPDDINQLRIDGRFSYRGQDAQGMKDVTDQSYQYKFDQINDILEGLQVSRMGANNNPRLAAEIDAKIQQYKDKAVQYQSSYKQDVATINDNLEGYKGALYSSNWLKKFGDSYAYSQESLTYKDNPYFMAAERRRENDIKYQEFMLDQRWKAADLDIKREQLKISQYNAETSRLSISTKAAKAAAKGALEGIPLSDAIFEPVQQDEIDEVNKNTFVKQTQDIGDEIDQQKMALLGNTGLVIIKRDPNGKNPRYEFNVAGKDPNLVKTTADAAIAKLKDDYDRDPNSVDDGARTYFQNQGNADQTIQNRKFAINQIEKNADTDVGTINPLLRSIRPFTITKGGQSYNITPTDMTKFNEKINRLHKTGVDVDVPYDYWDDTEAKKILTSPAEWEMYKAAKKPTSQRTEEDKKITAKLQQTFELVNKPARQVMAARSTYVDNAIKSIVGIQQPVSFTLEAFEAPDRKRAQAYATRIINSIVGEDKESPNPRYNKKKIEDMLGNEAENTTYSLVSKGRGRYAIALGNTKVTMKPIEFDITRQQAEETFGQGKFLDDFYNINQSLQLSKSTSKWTTDVRGLGKESAFNLNNDQLNRYSVKYHVEEPLKNGGLQVRMYIYDKVSSQWLPERTAGFGQLLNEAQVTKFLSTAGDQYIDALLQKDK